MAVKVSNVRNQRKARTWNEQDDSQLSILLKKKIRETAVAIRESESPYERSRLKAQRRRYKEMLYKVDSGAYNGDIIFNELRASAALSQEASFAANLHSSVAGGKKYSNAYGNTDFDYEAAFRKKRYYGAFLPIILTLLTIVMIASVFVGALIPSVIPSQTANQLSSGTKGMLNLNALFVYRLGEYDGDVFDIAVTADDNGKWWWPKANYPSTITITAGEPYTDEKGVTHDNDTDKVYLYADLGCTEIYIDAIDVIKAWFKTKMLEKTRIDVLEDLSIFQGTSYYYAIYLSGTKADELVIKKTEEGGYDFGVIYNHIGTYGTILFFLVTVILMVVLLIENIVRIFTYTSRRLHFTTLLCLIFSLLGLISPVFASCEGTEIGAAFSNYFMALTSHTKFLESSATSIGISIIYAVPAVICIIMLILPKLFRNRHKPFPHRIPKGNAKIHV